MLPRGPKSMLPRGPKPLKLYLGFMTIVNKVTGSRLLALVVTITRLKLNIHVILICDSNPIAAEPSVCFKM